MSQLPSARATIEHLVFTDEPGVELHPDLPVWAVDALTNLRGTDKAECPVPNCLVDIGWHRYPGGPQWQPTVLLRVLDGPIRVVCLDCGYPPALDIPETTP